MSKKRIIRIAKWFFGIIAGIILLISLLLYIFKKDIINYVVGEVNKNLNAKVDVEKIDLTFWGSFPNLSVDFEKVLISDSVSPSNLRDTVLYSELIRLKFNAFQLWRGNYVLKKAEIHPGVLHLKVDENGRENYNIVKKSDKPSDGKFNFKLEKVTFEKIRFFYANAITGQFYASYVNHLLLKGEFDEKQFTMAAKTDMHIDKIRNQNVTLLSDKPASFDLTIKIDREKNVFEIPGAKILISKLPFDLNGRIDPQQIRFNVTAKQLKLEEVATKLSGELNQIQKFEGQGFFNFDLRIQGDNAKNVMPVVVCNFDIQGGSLREPTQKLKFTNIYLNGKYSNEAGKNGEFIRLSNLRFNTISGPFQGEFLLTNFAKPHYTGKAQGSLDLKSIHGLFHIPYIQDIDGNLSVNSQFDIQTVIGPDGKSSIDIKKCLAIMEMKNINATVINDTRNFKSLNGKVNVEGDEAALQNISVKIGNSDFRLNGFFQDIAPYVSKQGKLLANVDLQSYFIDVKDLSSDKKAEQAAVTTVPERSFVLPDDIDATLLVNIGQLKYETHVFSKLRSNLTIGPRKLTFTNLSLENAKATVNGNLSIEETSPEYLLLRSNLSSDNLYFKNLFQEWNNFDQKIIAEDNISGKAHVDMVFQAPFDLRSGIMKNAIVSQIHIKIVDGALKNVSTFKSITESLKSSSVKFILNKRYIDEFEKKLLDLRFDVLENTLIIRNGKLEIPEMKIKSNALDIDTYGWHTFDNLIDYHFAFRFRDLKSIASQSEFGIVEDDGTGFRVYMRMTGSVDNPKIAWDDQAKKEQARENRQAAKSEAISILKSEFGFRKNDTTVKNYQPVKQPVEKLEMDFGNTKETQKVEEKKESELKKKLKDKLKKMKESTEEKVEFDVN